MTLKIQPENQVSNFSLTIEKKLSFVFVQTGCEEYEQKNGIETSINKNEGTKRFKENKIEGLSAFYTYKIYRRAETIASIAFIVFTIS